VIRAPKKGIVDNFALRIAGMCTVPARLDSLLYTVLLGGRDRSEIFRQRRFPGRCQTTDSKVWTGVNRESRLRVVKGV